MKHLTRLKVWIDGLALRERAMIFFAAVALLYAGWDHFLYSPLTAERKTRVSVVTEAGKEIQALNQQMGKMAQESRKDPDAGNRAKLAELRRQVAGLERTLEELTRRLVPPEKMAAVLESVLNRQTRLQLVKLEGLGAVPLLSDSGGASEPVEKPTAGKNTAKTPTSIRSLFKHGLRVEFEGEYMETLAYLRAVEALPWEFLWEDVVYQVEEYPSARVSITVYSLSLDEAWIGV